MQYHSIAGLLYGMLPTKKCGALDIVSYREFTSLGTLVNREWRTV